jgi:ribose transport system permease protein
VSSERSEGRARRAATAHRMRAGVNSVLQRYSLLVAWAGVILIFSLLPSTSAVFPTVANFANIFGTQAVIVVLTLALLVPLTAGDYDLSIAANLTLSAMIIAILNSQHHWDIYLAIIVALACGAAIGFTNGAIVVLGGIDPFIVTLGTGTILQGVVYWISNSATISGISTSLTDPVATYVFLGIPLEFWYGVALMAVMWFVCEYTPPGRKLLFVGRGRSVSRLSGVRVGRVRWGALVMSGIISAAAGVLYAGTTGAADPTSGMQFLLPCFAAAFLGATSFYPGRFNPIGSTVAVYFLATGITGLQLVGGQSYVQQLFYGGALVIAVTLTQIGSRKQGGSGVPGAAS